MVERLTGRISSVIAQTRFRSAAERLATFTDCVQACRHPIRRRALSHPPPVETLALRHSRQPDPFQKRAGALPGLTQSCKAAPPQNMTSAIVDPHSEVTAIKEARQAQNRAIASADLDTAEKFWTADITIRRALGQAVTGITEARKILEPAPNHRPAIIYQRAPTSVEVSRHWHLAYEEGQWTGHLDDVHSTAILAGRYAAQWVKRGELWLIRSEVFVALTCTGSGCDALAVL